MTSITRTALQTLFATRLFNQVAISPDGRLVAWVRPERIPGRPDASRLMIYLGPTMSGEPRRPPIGDDAGQYDEKEIVWSPIDRTEAWFDRYLKQADGGKRTGRDARK